MARYLATSMPRSELIPSRNPSEGPPLDALLDESERRRLKSYRPPTDVEPVLPAAVDAEIDPEPVTMRWSPAEIAALLSIARATIEADPEPSARTSPSTMPPRVSCRRITVRRVD